MQAQWRRTKKETNHHWPRRSFATARNEGSGDEGAGFSVMTVRVDSNACVVG